MKPQRTLPPTAAPIEWRDLLHGLVGLARPRATLNELRADLGRHFGAKHVWLVSSGKAALTLILRALHSLSGRQAVVMPGYTCFSVPSAVLRAGLSIQLYDVDPRTLNPDFSQLKELAGTDALCVIATHLLGVGTDVPRVVELCRPRGVFVVEDVAQAFGGYFNQMPFGAIGDVGFLSFGRGKNITCGSGGAIITNDDRIGEALAREYAGLSDVSIVGMLTNWLEVAITQMLIDPSRYWFPAGLPFLKLGETKFYTDFPMARMDAVRAGLLRRWRERLSRSTRSRVAHAAQIRRLLSEDQVQTIQPSQGGNSVYLRFPLLMPSSLDKDALCRISREQGLGISAMYPSAIQQVPELSVSLAAAPIPQSVTIAERLVTLPTHELVSDEDLKRMCAVVVNILRDQVIGTNAIAGGSQCCASELVKPN